MNTPGAASRTPVGGPSSRISWTPQDKCQASTRAAGMRATAIHRFGQIRRGKIDAKANSSGPAAALFANGSHRSPSSQAGSACQKTPSRIGSASESVASEASNNDPSSAEPSNDRLNATSMANASVPNCTSRNASTPVACGVRRHSLSPADSGRAAVKRWPSRSTWTTNGRDGSNCSVARCQSV